MLALLSAKNPAAALVIAVFFFPFENYYKLGVTVTSNELLILAISSGLLARLISGKIAHRGILKVCVLFLPFCLSMCISGALAASFPDAAKEILRWFSFFAVFVAAALSIHSRAPSEPHRADAHVLPRRVAAGDRLHHRVLFLEQEQDRSVQSR